MEAKNIVYIRTDNLYPHPHNPRKEIGDVEELADSISKNGIMQNLTVVPLSAIEEEPEKQADPNEISTLSDFHVLIGHRRLAAARKAGIQELPCKIISKITLKEQVGIMLEENMQRSDLTVYEQAQGFQMMLDLGETEESIAAKTGFSKTTVRRRLNIAKLNQDVLKEKEQQEGFQMTLTDLYELEKIEDVETRNKILSEATDSKNLAYRAQNAVKEAERKVKEQKLIAMLIEKGVEKAPDVYENEKYSDKWTTVKEYRTENELPEEIDLGPDTSPKFYYVLWYGVKVLKRTTKVQKKKTKAELERERIEKNKKEIKATVKKLDAARKEFVVSIVTGNINPISAKEEPEFKDILWEAIVKLGGCVYSSILQKAFTDKDTYKLSEEEKEAVKNKAEQLSNLHQMLIIVNDAMNGKEPFDYYGKFKQEYGETMSFAYGIFKKLGWSFENDEEKKIINGTSDLYVKDEPKAEE